MFLALGKLKGGSLDIDSCVRHVCDESNVSWRSKVKPRTYGGIFSGTRINECRLRITRRGMEGTPRAGALEDLVVVVEKPCTVSDHPHVSGEAQLPVTQLGLASNHWHITGLLFPWRHCRSVFPLADQCTEPLHTRRLCQEGDGIVTSTPSLCRCHAPTSTLRSWESTS